MLKRLLLLVAILFACSMAPAAAQDVIGGELNYRGFIIDVSQVQHEDNFNLIEEYAKHQLDIVADCGASNAVLSFFRSQKMIMKLGLGHGGGVASARGDISLDASPESPDKPIFLHELLHAFHFRALTGGVRNEDVLTFYQRAKANRLYPDGAYVLKNPTEFFAVTASLYLWGHVDRPPYSRDVLKATQPVYYAWLGRLFGVNK